MHNIFPTAGFEHHRTISMFKDTMEKVGLTVDSARTSTNDGAWQNLDALLCRVAAIGEHLSTNEFVKTGKETPVFSEWKNAEDLSSVQEFSHN